MGPFGFSAIRSIIGGLSMLAIHPLLNKINKDSDFSIDKAQTRRASLICGPILFFAMNLQQYSLLYTSTGKAGFITTLYIIIIPVMRGFMGVKISKKMIFCIIGSTIGLYLITVKENLSINIGDVMVFVSAVFYSVHTLLLADFSPRVDAIKLNAYQFLICGFMSAIPMVIFEGVNSNAVAQSIGSILYVGILSSAFAYLFQIIGLRNVDPTIASLILSLESIFAIIGGFFILNQTLTLRETLGCLIMLISTIAVQIPLDFFKKKVLKKS